MYACLLSADLCSQLVLFQRGGPSKILNKYNLDVQKVQMYGALGNLVQSFAQY